MKKGRLLTIIILGILGALGWSGDVDVMAGLASWYGEDFHGKMTANGEIYDMTSFTAAHRTLPFGTMVKVVNLLNNRAIIVRINDRGPFKDERIIDVSKAAAEELDFIKNGIIPVRIEVLVEGREGVLEEAVSSVMGNEHADISSQQEEKMRETLPVSSSSSVPTVPIVEGEEGDSVTGNSPVASNRDILYVQVGSYRDKTNAIRTAKVLTNIGFPVQIKESNGYYRVFFEQDPKKVNDSLRLLQDQGYKDPLVRKTMIDGEEVNWRDGSNLASL